LIRTNNTGAGDASTVTVNGGELSSSGTGGTAIRAYGTTSTVTVNDGELSATGINGVAINAANNTAANSVKVTGGVVSAVGTGGTAIKVKTGAVANAIDYTGGVILSSVKTTSGATPKGAIYNVKFGFHEAGTASGSTISATYDGILIPSNVYVSPGEDLVITAVPAGATYYTREWTGEGIGSATGKLTDTLTITGLVGDVDTVINIVGAATAGGDQTPPTVASVTPSGTGAEIQGSVVVVFDEAMDTTITGYVELNDTLLTGSGQWSNGDKTYTIPYSGLSYSTEYTVTISDFDDFSGNQLVDDSSHSFTTKAYSSGGGSGGGSGSGGGGDTPGGGETPGGSDTPGGGETPGGGSGGTGGGGSSGGGSGENPTPSDPVTPDDNETPAPTESAEEVEVGELPSDGSISLAPIPIELDGGGAIVNPVIPANDPGLTALSEIGVAVRIEGGALVVEGQATMVGDFTITVTGVDGEGNPISKQYTIKIEPHDVPDASDIVTENPSETVTTILTGSPTAPDFSITLPTLVSYLDAENAMRYAGTRFSVSGTGNGQNGIRITGGRFLLGGGRGADGSGASLEITGSIAGADPGEAALETVSYVVGINRYTENVGIRLADTNLIVETSESGDGGNGGESGNGGGTSSGGGCSTGVAGLAGLAMAGLIGTTAQRKRR
jgi:hypothetical protein